ncbi:hypothetical protein SNEBB_007695 [Seison nebaliae]|nr:hypothetical protein SNEBB_007695 [Seison nebaliae]
MEKNVCLLTIDVKGYNPDSIHIQLIIPRTIRVTAEVFEQQDRVVSRYTKQSNLDQQSKLPMSWQSGIPLHGRLDLPSQKLFIEMNNNEVNQSTDERYFDVSQQPRSQVMDDSGFKTNISSSNLFRAQRDISKRIHLKMLREYSECDIYLNCDVMN